jgi:hypothetical protein
MAAKQPGISNLDFLRIEAADFFGGFLFSLISSTTKMFSV